MRARHIRRWRWKASAILLTYAVLLTPQVAHTQTVWCCCNPEISVCRDASAFDNCGSSFPQHISNDDYRPRCTTVQTCDELVSCVADIPTVCPPDDDDPNGVRSCPPAAPNAAAPTRSWIGAIPGIGDELIPPACRTGDAKGCTLNHLLQVLANVTRVMLAVLGSAAFAMFIYGGVVFLTSMGNQERVTTGRRILANAVLGILVVLVSWTAVNFVVVALSQGRGGFGQVGQIFSNSWNRGP